MKNLKEISIAMLVLVASFGLHSCTKEKITKEEPKASTKLQTSEKQITKIDLGAKGTVEFFELAPGDLYVDMSLSSIDYAPKEKDLNPLEIYEFFKNEKAPVELVEAYDRAITPGNTKTNDAVVKIDGAKMDYSRLTAAQFQSYYCTGSWDFIYCWVNRTNTSYVRRTCEYMTTTANPYRGSIRHILKYYASGTWYTVRDKIVLQDYISIISSWNYSVDRYREAMVTEAGGDGYHHSIRGND